MNATRRNWELVIGMLVLATPAVLVAYWLLGNLQMRGW